VTATPGRWIASAVFAAAASFFALSVARSWSGHPPPADLLRYPEVADADRALVRRFWTSLDSGRTALAIVRPDEEMRRDEQSDAGEELVQSLREAPGPACRALLRVLCVWRFQPPFDLEIGSGADETPRTWLAEQIRSNCGPADVRVLGRIAADPALAAQARGLAIDAIARPGDPVAAEVLEELALDRSVDPEIRRRAIERLPRLRSPLTPRIHRLLDEPFARLDEAAAVALLRCGDAEAPSLVADARLRRRDDGSDTLDRRLRLRRAPRGGRDGRLDRRAPRAFRLGVRAHAPRVLHRGGPHGVARRRRRIRRRLRPRHGAARDR
jgi:hypothetical protein